MVIFDLAEGARPEPNYFNRLVKMVGSGQICGPGCRNRLYKNPLEFLVCAIPQSRGKVPGAPEHATVIGDLLDALKVGNKGLYFISVFHTARIYTVFRVCQYPSRFFYRGVCARLFTVSHSRNKFVIIWTLYLYVTHHNYYILSKLKLLTAHRGYRLCPPASSITSIVILSAAKDPGLWAACRSAFVPCNTMQEAA